MNEREDPNIEEKILAIQNFVKNENAGVCINFLEPVGVYDEKKSKLIEAYNDLKNKLSTGKFQEIEHLFQTLEEKFQEYKKANHQPAKESRYEFALIRTQIYQDYEKEGKLSLESHIINCRKILNEAVSIQPKIKEEPKNWRERNFYEESAEYIKNLVSYQTFNSILNHLPEIPEFLSKDLDSFNDENLNAQEVIPGIAKEIQTLEPKTVSAINQIPNRGQPILRAMLALELAPYLEVKRREWMAEEKSALSFLFDIMGFERTGKKKFIAAEKLFNSVISGNPATFDNYDMESFSEGRLGKIVQHYRETSVEPKMSVQLIQDRPSEGSGGP